ncbi:MAG: NAD+ synthase [Deltaproteobacteria bacterium]|uniref:Glutamine-dependent NAD(+) synthetase n=1 Tax=Candidatus Zymogenus saltonus TaxID=2844893 RepID=A0A9D8KH51_9DELT|nr:NAD+ synthase [Candidatus Zymogenus saltonus]
MGILRIAQAQINTTVGDLGGNSAKVASYIKRAVDADADIVTFPELAISGYPPEDILLKPQFLRDCRKAIESVFESTDGIAAVVGFPDFAGDKVFNAAALIYDRKLLAIYHKVELPNYGVFDEKRYFTSGNEPLTFLLNGKRLMVTVCEDIWIEGSPVENFALDNDVDIALNLSGSPFHAGKIEIRKKIASSFAVRTNTFVCYNNLVGGQDELVFDGTSLVVNREGNVIDMGKRFEEDLFITDFADTEIDTAVPFPRREAQDAEIVIETEGGKRKTAEDRPIPEIARRKYENHGEIDEIWRALVLGTGDYVRKNGFKKVVIGLSGGIDSTLTAAVAVAALGKENVIGVTMPSMYTSDETFKDSDLTAKNLGIRLITVPIEPIFISYLDLLEGPFGEGEPGVEAENLQARIRGNILMALSNRFGWLVLTTGNKSEMAVGYATLYGDMAGGFAVIKDVPKTTVYKVSEYVNKIEGREVIPKSVIERPPTAELRPDQKDEDSLPPYEVLDPILSAYVEGDEDPKEIAKRGYDIETVLDVVKMVDRNEYKRRQAPPGVKITPKAFGRDRRLPITNRYPKR